MQVFIVGTSLETAMILDKRRLNKQIIECRQILDALNGKKAWSNHPCTLQYKNHQSWLNNYILCLTSYQKGDIISSGRNSYLASREKPPFHTQEYLEQMKRRLYTKNPEHYKQWAYLGKSEENWYWSQSENKFIKYINGKRVE